MSLNGAELLISGSSGETPSPVLVQGEKLFIEQVGVSMDYSSGNGYPGQGNSYFIQTGSMFLTNIRVIYIAKPVQNIPPTVFSFTNLNMPLHNVQDPQLAQPWFSCNRIDAIIIPVPNGGLTMNGKAKFHFNEGGAFEFLSTLKHLQMRLEMANSGQPLEDQLPLYADIPNVEESTQPEQPPSYQ